MGLGGERGEVKKTNHNPLLQPGFDKRPDEEAGGGEDEDEDYRFVF